MTKIKAKHCKDGTYNVYTPYNEEFINRIKRIGSARWDAYEKAWNIPEESLEFARAAMQEIYGETDITSAQKLVTIRVKFDDDYCEECGGVVAFGRTLARAFGRDSGAKVGDGVILESVRITSGGSRRYWETIVKSGCVFQLSVPECIYEKEKDDWNCEIVAEMNEETKRAAMIEEREKLLARLTEIEKELE